jgi:predicted Zn-dependent protease
MATRAGFVAVLVALIAGGMLTFMGRMDQDVSFASVLEIWGDVLRDVDQFGLKLTRVSDHEEMAIGDEIANDQFFGGDAVPSLAAYVTEVGETLVPGVRRAGITYTFHVIESPEVNAFAIPGGHVYVLTGMLEFLRSESELAAILGHEISHVDLRHCIERMQYGAALEKIGVGTLGRAADMLRGFAAVGYNKYQELEADAQGARLSAEAGYDPATAVDVFERLEERFGGAEGARPRTPIGELGQALGDALGSYLVSHPPSQDRSRRLAALVGDYQKRLAGRELRVGADRYAEELRAN